MEKINLDERKETLEMYTQHFCESIEQYLAVFTNLIIEINELQEFSKKNGPEQTEIETEGLKSITFSINALIGIEKILRENFDPCRESFQGLYDLGEDIDLKESMKMPDCIYTDSLSAS